MFVLITIPFADPVFADLRIIIITMKLNSREI